MAQKRYNPITTVKIGKRGSTIRRGKSPQKTALHIKMESHGHGFLKICIVALLVLIQLIVLVSLFLWLSGVFWGYLAFSFVASVLAALHVLSTEKSGHNKSVWILFLLCFFFCGYVFYIFSYVEPFYGKSREKYEAIKERTKQYDRDEVPALDDPRLRQDVLFFRTVGPFPVWEHTQGEYFPSGTKLFDDLLERIEGAEKFIFLEFFIVADGSLLHNLSAVLMEKAKAGVDVRFIYDDMGPKGQFSRRTKKMLKEAGVKLYPFNRLLPLFSLSINYRDHRKIVVIDGKIAYTGGVNLADEYINAKRMYGYWKDAGIRIEGDGVDEFTLLFLRQWEYLTDAKEDYAPYLSLAEKKEGSPLIVYGDGLDYRANVGRSAYINLFAKAEEKLYLMVPYFLPDETIENLLIEKAHAGVDVRLLIPEIPDKPFVYAQTRNYAERLLSHGIRVFVMKDSFVHAKVMLTDYAAIVGSVNIDSRSFYEESECAVYTADAKILSEISEDFTACFGDSVEIKERKQSLGERIVTGFLRILSPLM